MSSQLELLDCNFFVGHPSAGSFDCFSTAEELLAAVRHVGVVGGLAWHIAQRDFDAAEGNRMLSRAIEGCGALWGCWTILPPQTGEVVTSDFFDRMKRCRIAALRAFPGLHRYQLKKWVFGSFWDELVSRNVPLLLSVEGNTSWPAIYGILEESPEMTCVLCDIGIWGVDRQVWPLLERYPNVYVESSLLSLAEHGMEDTVRRFGAERVLFGTGFPARYAEAAALQLLHADISESDRINIAGANLRRLVSRVKL